MGQVCRSPALPEGSGRAHAWRRLTRKAAQGMGLWMLVIVILCTVWPAGVWMTQFWMVVIIGLLANILQPSYRPLEGSRTPQDRGTAAQILWTVYLSQGAALIELVCRHRLVLAVDALTWFALSAMMVGLALRTWAVWQLGPWFTWNVTVQTGQRLITGGPYRLVRHPGYTGALITFVAGCVILHSWAAAVLSFLALTFAFQRRIRHEEALLIRTLPGYAAYAARTGQLLPRLP